jgi:hypothetical protein
MFTIEPKDRLELVVKILPFVPPKTGPVHYKENEPISGRFDDKQNIFE